MSRSRTGLARLRVAPYARVSNKIKGKLKGGRMKSVNDQLAEYEADFDEHPKWREVDRFAEAGSASQYALHNRAEYTRLQEAIVNDKFDLLWLWEISRLGRDMDDWIPLRQLLTKKGMLVYVCQLERLFDFSNPEDVVDMSEAIQKAEREAVQISVRIRRGIRHSVKAGDPHGKIPYGYLRTTDREQLPHPVTSLIVIEICERVAKGDTIYSIAMDLTERGVPTPRGAKDDVWSERTVKLIATRPTYVGRRRYEGKQTDKDGKPLFATVDGNWPPLISTVLHEQCIRQAGNPERKEKYSRPTKCKHLLSRIMVCAKCGSVVSRGLQRDKVTENYYCEKKGCVRGLKAMLDEAVLGAVKEYLARRQFSLAEDLSDRIEAARERAARARTDLAAWREQLDDEEVDVEDYNRRAKVLRKAIKDAEGEVASLAVPAPLQGLMSADDPGEAWIEAALPVKRQILREMFIIVLHPTGPGRQFGLHQLQIELV